MGILNITPDSYFEGGNYLQPDTAIRHATQMANEGAAIIDIGGESTRPSATEISEQQELDRIIPVIEKLHHELDIPISVDTSKATVMQQAIKAGAGLINDIWALRRPGALDQAASHPVAVCLMHMAGTPKTMQQDPKYDDIMTEIYQFLAERIDACIAKGIPRQQIIIDPGFGFGKTVQHNMTIMQQLNCLQSLNVPLLLGVSRKATIGAILNKPVGTILNQPAGTILNKPVTQRLYGSIALTALAVSRGVKLIRAHDVQATVEAIKMAMAATDMNMEKT